MKETLEVLYSRKQINFKAWSPVVKESHCLGLLLNCCHQTEFVFLFKKLLILKVLLEAIFQY